MSSITRQGNRLIQRAGNDVEELGYIGFDQNTNVLWLKDTCGVLNLNGGYIRGDEFTSMEEAKKNAASSPSAFIMHYIWMRRSIKAKALATVNDNWEEISISIAQKIQVNKEAMTDKISEYFDKIPIEKIKEWSKKISENLLVSMLIELIKTLFK